MHFVLVSSTEAAEHRALYLFHWADLDLRLNCWRASLPASSLQCGKMGREWPVLISGIHRLRRMVSHSLSPRSLTRSPNGLPRGSLATD
ncbi:MAG: hypothetical protein LBV73_20395, partial [Paraburkholderia sp.]|nr:hypothetical protein [Paraburkholderia sp.]